MKTAKRILCLTLALVLICGLSAHAGIIVYKHLADPVLFHGSIEQPAGTTEPRLVCLIDGTDTSDFGMNDFTGGRHTTIPVLNGHVMRISDGLWVDEDGREAITAPKIVLKTEDGSPFHGDIFFTIQIHARNTPLSEDIASALKFKYVKGVYDATGLISGTETDEEIGTHMADGYAESYPFHLGHDVLCQDGYIELDIATYAKSEAAGDFDIAIVFFTGDFAS